MKINTSDYIGSFPSVEKCPVYKRPEYAFIGRSNVGKSSLINSLVDRNGLARVSKQPGKTQSLNFYLINDRWNLVDLPGYGYAKVSKKMRGKWELMIKGYFRRREALQCAFVLVDCSVSPQQNDMDFINFLGDIQIPFAIIYTKADKDKPRKVNENIKAFEEKLLENWETMPQTFKTSALKKEGQEEILDLIETVNKDFFHG